MTRTRLTIHQLRQEAYEGWETVLMSAGAYPGGAYMHELDETATAERLPWTNQQFKAEIRQRFGDLRRRDTWEQAAIAYEAQAMALVDGSLEPIDILKYMAIDDPYNGPIRQHYKDAVLQQMLMYPDLLALIKEMLEAIYHSGDAEERAVAGQFMATVGARLALAAA